jgi:hypothetical protein
MKTLLKMIAGLALGILEALMLGLVLSHLWAWFIVPVFAGTALIGYVQAVGVALVVNLLLLNVHSAVLTRKPESSDKTDWVKPLVTSATKTFFIYPLALLIGYVWSLFL